ncbi:MAG: regulatory iron-sulfur-containing complex subunit RicT [Candidatus Coproplasma sp.]
MTKVISVKFKGGGKSYYFAPCAQDVEKGMGVIVETSKGLEYAIVTEGVHEVEESAIVPPLMPTVRIATKSDLEQIERNEARKDDAMKIVKEKIEARGLDMKPVGCEFSFDGTKIIVYFTSENRVDFRELIKDLSSAFRMRIELRQIGIREEIKLMGGLAPCGRECCCVRSLQEPKKVSVKMAKNQGLSLNPSKISGLCGRLMCCLSYENDYYADVCKKVPKLGSEATTPDGKGMVVNVNMLKMIVKVKIEQGDSVTYKDFPLDKISFMRGNEVIGAVGGDDEDEELQEAEGALDFDESASEGSEKAEISLSEGKNGERRIGDKNRDKRANDRQNRKNGEEQSGDKPALEQGKETAQGNGKNRNKKHKRHGKQGEAKVEKDNNTNFNPRQNQQNGKGEKAKNVQANVINATNQGANNQEASGNGRSRKKHRFNKNRGAKDGAANKVNTEGQKNNA